MLPGGVVPSSGEAVTPLRFWIRPSHFWPSIGCSLDERTPRRMGGLCCFLAAGLSRHPSPLAALSIRLVQREAEVGTRGRGGAGVRVGPG